MPDAQKAQLKDMGMDPDTMLVSMKMMKDNPQMMKTAQELMSNMTPEQMLEQSRAAQKKMSSMTKEEMQQAADMAKTQMETLPDDLVEVAMSALKETSADNAAGTKPLPDGVVPGSSSDPNVIDAMYEIGELMSLPPDGKVTFQAFATLPPVTILSGDRDQDLSRNELAECWSDGSLGASRVDRAGFERVWKEVQDYFEEDIMEESRRSTHPKAKKVRSATSLEPEMPRVGGNLSETQMKDVNEAVKKMTDDDMMQMLDGMASIGPEEEARMKAMGADPAMMRKAAGMMKSNPLMRKAAQTMMKNMNPEQMVKASQQAQEQMSRMSQDDMESAMDQISKNTK